MVTLPRDCIGDGRDVLNSYYESKQIIPLEICIRESGHCGYYYHFLPEFNPNCFARLRPEHVATDLIELCERTVKKISYLPSTMMQPGAGDGTRRPVDEDQCVYLAWIGLWCASLWYQSPEEQGFRLEQLLDVLTRMQAKTWHVSIEMFQLIMQSCLNYGSPDMVITVYQRLPSFNVRANGGICSIYFKAISLTKEAQGPIKRILAHSPTKTSSTKVAADVRPPGETLDPACLYYKDKTKLFKERTFLTAEEQSILGDKVLISVEGNSCPSCGADLKYEEIAKGARQPTEPMAGVELYCIKCGQAIFPQMKLRIGKCFNLGAGPKTPTYTEQAATLMVPQQFKEMIEKLALQATNRVKIDLPRIRSFYKSIFWNAIWHFSRLQLPYDLFLPYRKDVCYEGVVQSFSSVSLTSAENWESEDKKELEMQQKYEDKIRKKVVHKDTGALTNISIPKGPAGSPSSEGIKTKGDA